MATEFEKQMLEVAEKWLGYIKEKVNSDTPQPTPTPKPEPTPVPVSTDPEIIYNGKSEYTLAPGEHTKFNVYVNNVSSSRDYTVETVGDPVFMGVDEVGYKTNTGYKLAFDVKGGANYGKGTIKVYLTKKRDVCVTISIITKP